MKKKSKSRNEIDTSSANQENVHDIEAASNVSNDYYPPEILENTTNGYSSKLSETIPVEGNRESDTNSDNILGNDVPEISQSVELENEKTISVPSLHKNIPIEEKNKQKKADLQQSSFEKFLAMNKQILYTLDNIDSIPVQHATASTSNKIDTLESETKYIEDLDLKPYTEQQLRALYYNSELNVLKDFTKRYVEMEMKGLHLKKHCLYDLLANYLKVRENIIGECTCITQSY